MAIQKPGFRVYKTDVALFVAAGLLSYALSLSDFTGAFYMMPVYIIASFFMFCNVLRIGTTLEAVFAVGVLVDHTVMYVQTGNTFDMYKPMALGILGVTVISILLGWYRGVFWRFLSRFSHRSPEEITDMPQTVLKVRDSVTYLFYRIISTKR